MKARIYKTSDNLDTRVHGGKTREITSIAELLEIVDASELGEIIIKRSFDDRLLVNKPERFEIEIYDTYRE